MEVRHDAVRLLTRYLLRHPSMEACLAELGRNPALRRVVGIEDGQAVPDSQQWVAVTNVADKCTATG